ncbi:hypothetical protein HHI36_005072 [Cryptolaemus montrouzieri]|uniref:Uncharacterized protein n=1 Tax=Cryptolaemus montrouzieri TaxID=559131 RepID=A0ABD2NTK7_9CUCU
MYPYQNTNYPSPNMARPFIPSHMEGGQSYFWVPSSRGQTVPSNAVVCGKDKDGSDIYVGQATYGGDELPAKIIPRRREAYVCFNEKEMPVSDYRILVEKKLTWVHNVGGRIPPGAVPAGRTFSGETLYVGRKIVEGRTTAVGKVHPSHGCLYVPYGGRN